MRTVKFRQPIYSLQGEFKTFHYWGFLENEFKAPAGFISVEQNRNKKNKQHDQFTGFHDIEGKEIYEGDILENDLGRIVKIYWHSHSGSWDYQALNSEGRPIHFMDKTPMFTRVIGNIHENPELL